MQETEISSQLYPATSVSRDARRISRWKASYVQKLSKTTKNLKLSAVVSSCSDPHSASSSKRIASNRSKNSDRATGAGRVKSIVEGDVSASLNPVSKQVRVEVQTASDEEEEPALDTDDEDRDPDDDF